MPAPDYNAPRMTRDGKSAVHYCYYGYPAYLSKGRGRCRPEEKLKEIFAMIATEELEYHSSIYEWDQPEYWEFKYLHHGMGRPASTWEQFCAHRAKMLGSFTISGNFVNVSHCFRVDTRDPDLVESFRQAFANNPGKAKMDEWHRKCETVFQQKREWWGINPPEEVVSESKPETGSCVHP